MNRGGEREKVGSERRARNEIHGAEEVRKKNETKRRRENTGWSVGRSVGSRKRWRRIKLEELARGSRIEAGAKGGIESGGNEKNMGRRRKRINCSLRNRREGGVRGAFVVC